MKTVRTMIMAVALCMLVGTKASSQCSYYVGQCYASYVSPNYLAQGESFFVQGFMYVWDSRCFPDASYPLEISSDNGASWSTLVDNCPMNYTYNGGSYCYGYPEATVTIPWTFPAGNYVVRIREVPNNPDECQYSDPWYETYDGYWQRIQVVRGCRDPLVTNITQSFTGCQGSDYSITGTGYVDPGNIVYQWFKNGVVIAKTDTPTMLFTPINTTHAGTYYFQAIDVCGRTFTSPKIDVKVNIPGIITKEPVGKTVCPGQSYTLSIAATGALKYQWYRNGTAVAGKTTNSYAITNATLADQGQYFVVVTGACGDPDTSNKVTITVPYKPVFTTPLEGGLFCPGSVAVIKPDVTGDILTYQWYKGDSPIIGATSRNLSIEKISTADNGFYWVEVSVPGADQAGCSATTKSGRVFVGAHQPPVILKQPNNIDVCAGETTHLVVEADGTGLTYQWLHNNVVIPNSNNYSLPLENISASDAGEYVVKITGACGYATTSNIVNVNVYSLPVVTSQPQSTTVRLGETITLDVGATDVQTVVWMHNEAEIARGTSTTLTINNAQLDHAGYYRALIQNVCGGITSRSALVGVIDPASLVPTIGIASPGLDVGNVPFGYSAERTFSALVVNAGNVDVTVNGYSFTGTNAADYVVQAPATPYTLAPGEAHEVAIRFTPSVVGTSHAVLNVTSTATAGVNAVPIVGQGVVLYVVDQVVDFGTVDKAQTTIKCFDVTNTSTTDVVIDAVNISGTNSDEFRTTSAFPLTILAGSATEVCIEFKPLSEGSRSVQLALMSSTGGNSNVTAIGRCEIATSVVEDGSTAGMTIYPNPASGTAVINIGAEKATSLSIFDVHGALVYTTEPTQSTYTWNLRSSTGNPVAAGTYNVLITNGVGRYHLTLQVVR